MHSVWCQNLLVWATGDPYIVTSIEFTHMFICAIFCFFLTMRLRSSSLSKGGLATFKQSRAHSQQQPYVDDNFQELSCSKNSVLWFISLNGFESAFKFQYIDVTTIVLLYFHVSFSRSNVGAPPGISPFYLIRSQLLWKLRTCIIFH